MARKGDSSATLRMTVRPRFRWRDRDIFKPKFNQSMTVSMMRYLRYLVKKK
jgi:hypothetical protein